MKPADGQFKLSSTLPPPTRGQQTQRQLHRRPRIAASDLLPGRTRCLTIFVTGGTGNLWGTTVFKKVTVQTRRELVEAIRVRYLASSREEKTRILQEFSATTGCHRKSAIRILNGAGRFPDHGVQHPRHHLYDGAVREALVVLWEAADRICGKRLKAILPALTSALERHQHLQVEPTVRAKLMAMSPATMDRLSISQTWRQLSKRFANS
jgi:hypothetical protein